MCTLTVLMALLTSQSGANAVSDAVRGSPCQASDLSLAQFLCIQAAGRRADARGRRPAPLHDPVPHAGEHRRS